MPLEQLLAMYGYSIPTEEGEDEEGEEEEEEGDGVGSGEEEEELEGNSPPTTTSQASTNPSSPSPPPSSSSHRHQIETSHKKSSKSKMDSKPSNNAPVSSEQLDIVHDIIDDHDLAEEVEIEEHPADFSGSSSSSVLGKHPRSEEEPGHDAVYRDVMLSSRTALEGTILVVCMHAVCIVSFDNPLPFSVCYIIYSK